MASDEARLRCVANLASTDHDYGMASTQTVPRIIYDFGANNGDNVAYYLRKAERVVAIEANPVLAAQIQARFAAAIASKRLFVEACVVTAGSEAATVPFYLHRTHHPMSQFPRPEKIADYEEIALPSRPVAEILAEHGQPFYIKIDIEHYDEAILRAVFDAGVFPPFISAEAHSVDIFAVLLAIGGYRAFKLIDGCSGGDVYRDLEIAALDGPERRSFAKHSAGPFGDDIDGPWRSADHISRILAAEEFGWKELHASHIREPDLGAAMNLRQLGITALRKWACRRIGSLVPLSAAHPIKQFLDV